MGLAQTTTDKVMATRTIETEADMSTIIRTSVATHQTSVGTPKSSIMMTMLSEDDP